jgi:3-dehydroquinate dehydratase I
MANKKIANKLPTKPSVVGVIHSASSLATAMRLAPDAIDYLEIRVDAFHGSEEKILSQLPRLKFPLIITVRHFSEGGLHRIPTAKRRALFEKFLPHATLVDIELRSAKELANVSNAAHKIGVGVILSHHNFSFTAPASRLTRLAREAEKAGADIFKIATLASGPVDVANLLLLQNSQKNTPFSIMGMGRFGKVSRLLFAGGGSLLNYGFLDEANASGQWPAVLLKKRIAELPV